MGGICVFNWRGAFGSLIRSTAVISIGYIQHTQQVALSLLPPFPSLPSSLIPSLLPSLPPSLPPSLLPGDFMRGDSAQVYEDITSFPDLKKLMEEKLEDYNMEPGVVSMNLVLFRDAIEHGEEGKERAYRVSSNRGPGLYFLLGPFSTWLLNKAGFYTGPASIYAHRTCSGFLRVLFCAVCSSKLESDIVLLSLGRIMKTICETRTSTELSSCCAYT